MTGFFVEQNDHALHVMRMVVLSSIVVKAVLIAAGGIIITVFSVATIVLLYLCTCHSKPRGEQ